MPHVGAAQAACSAPLHYRECLAALAAPMAVLACRCPCREIAASGTTHTSRRWRSLLNPSLHATLPAPLHTPAADADVAWPEQNPAVESGLGEPPLLPPPLLPPPLLCCPRCCCSTAAPCAAAALAWLPASCLLCLAFPGARAWPMGSPEQPGSQVACHKLSTEQWCTSPTAPPSSRLQLSARSCRSVSPRRRPRQSRSAHAPPS